MSSKTEFAPFVYPLAGENVIYAGTDEAGRGPLVGNVVAAAVILDPENHIEGLADSKKLTEKKRDALYDVIMEKALAVGVGIATPAEIDEYNILWASMLAMERAVESLSVVPGMILVDGNKIPKHLMMPAQAVVKGDARVKEISAASIIAKVTRDRELIELDRLYPQYGFASHKGYPTAAHLRAIKEFGLIDGLYRKSYRPVKEILDAHNG